jgi:hypothetical protein
MSVLERLSESGLSVFVHSPYSLDRVLSDFLLFHHVEDTILRTIEMIPRVILIDAFASWEESWRHGSRGKVKL